jgi:hypothetical protein
MALGLALGWIAAEVTSSPALVADPDNFANV